MIPEEIDGDPPDRQNFGSSWRGRSGLGMKSWSEVKGLGGQSSLAPVTTSTSWEVSEPSRVGAGVCGPARMDQTHARSRIMAIC